jgi:hypothetical protein
MAIIFKNAGPSGCPCWSNQIQCILHQKAAKNNEKMPKCSRRSRPI